MAKRFRDPRTRAIIKRIFFLLLPEGGVNGEALQPFEVDLACWGERDARVIRDVSEKVREIVCSSAETSVGQSVEDFERHHWEVTQADLYAEYHRVVEVNFRDEVNWGRVVTFLAFAASFAVYVDRRGLQCSAVQSVEAWTSQVIETTLADYFIRSNGWVSGVAPPPFQGLYWCLCPPPPQPLLNPCHSLYLTLGLA